VPLARFRSLSLPLRLDSLRGLERVGNGWVLRGSNLLWTSQRPA